MIRISEICTAVILMLLGLTLASPSFGEDVFTPDDVARLSYVGSVAVSPNGTHVAYTKVVQRNPLDANDGPAWVELHVADAAGKSRPFVTGAVNVSDVQWTPDGSGIAFTSKRAGDEHASLYIIPIDGGEAQRTIAHETGLHGVTFSVDGKYVAFLAKEPSAKTKRDWREKGFDQEIFEEDWKPVKVWLAAADGSGQPRALDLDGSVHVVRFSPSGNELAVVLAPTPSVDDSYMFKRIKIVDIASGAIVESIDNPGKLGQIGFSPDGKHLAMVSGADIHDPREGRLMVASIPSDGQIKDLMPSYEAHVDSFAWKDGQTLVWSAAEGCSSKVGQVSLDAAVEIWTEGEGPILHGLSMSSNRRVVACLGNSPNFPNEVFLANPKIKAFKRLTNTNPWIEKNTLARQEVIEWTARDGLKLEGVLIYPLHYVEGRRYPLILTVHGGPESCVPNGWVTRYSYPGQVGAARGFAIFYPNYRGSTGRGVEFSKLGQADAAGREFDDLVDAVDHLVNMGLVAKEKVGITGGSYGGYASAWGATYYSERFAASVMFVGISDNVSKIGTTDIPEEMYLVHHRKRLWDDTDYFVRRSPIRYVERNRTPTLILHGKEDPRVHPSQSLELHRHLKTLGQAPVRLVFYPGEGHGNRRAAARLDYNLRMMRWMEHFLKDSGEEAPNFEIDYAAECGDNRTPSSE
jgi:dipeptidyl aminopeptidase/acylaminoacyl peptidase